MPTASRMLLVATLAAATCAPSCVQPEALRPRTAGEGGTSVSLRYEGTCAMLACCASGLPVPNGTLGASNCEALGEPHPSHCAPRGWFAPGFTCNPTTVGAYRQPNDPPYLACNDNDPWLSLPHLTHAHCGKEYVVCFQGKRVVATARDRSAPNDSNFTHYEGSAGLILALGGDLDARETFVSIYARDDMPGIASDPACVGTSVP